MTREKASDSETHFGYRRVAAGEKADLVRGVFDSVAGRYDLMNDLMSGGIHRLWKRRAVAEAGVRAGQRVLDLAGGTGDLAMSFARLVTDRGHVVLADINASMLHQGRRRLLDAGIVGNVSLAQVDAEALPFAPGSFDVVTIAFGLRNVTRKEAALAAMRGVLKPGGKLLILEFSHPVEGLQPIYDLYSFRVLPLLGRLVAGDEESYRYLAESIRMHPDQETLLGMMGDAGLERCRYINLTGGIAALHIGYHL